MKRINRKKVTMFVVALTAWSGLVISSSLADALKTSSDFDSLPTAVKSYVIDIGVEQDLKNPAEITFDSGTMFLLPVPASDLNNDGKIDYYAAACMFSPKEFESIYQTNGFPCASAVLLLSYTGGGYERIETKGLLISAIAGKLPRITIVQRNYNDCGDVSYTCKSEYTVEIDNDSGRGILKLQHIVPDL